MAPFKANIDFKSILDKYKTLKARNRAFKSLTSEGKRLEIAWDALQLILLGMIRGSNGSYWNYHLMNRVWKIKTSEELHKSLNDLSTFKTDDYRSCEVCQRGALMLSQIRLGNTLSPKSSDIACGNDKNIKGFTLEQFRVMEDEYEYSLYSHPYHCNSDEKMANILCNVLVNGEFDTEDKTDYLIHDKK